MPGIATLRRNMLSPRGGTNSGPPMVPPPAASPGGSRIAGRAPDPPDSVMPVKVSLAPLETLRRSNTTVYTAAPVTLTKPRASVTLSGGAVSPMETAERRMKIVKEILTSEVSYVANLDRILEDMKIVKAAPMVQAKQVTRIFGNIDMVHNLHSKQFLPELKTRLRSFNEKTQLGDLFLTHLPYFKAVYTQYVSNYSNALETLRQLWTVSSFTDYIRNNWTGDGTVPFDMHLRSLLITPVQRVPRYELLLKDLVRATDAHHADMQNLTQAQTNMVAVAEWANEKKGDADRMLQLIELSGALRTETQRESVVLAKPGRNYMCEATFTQPRPKDKPPRITNLHVFSDCILIARRKDGSEQRSFDGLIYIKSLRVDVLSEICIVLNTDKDVLSPIGNTETKKWYLTAASATDCAAFVNIVNKLKADIQKKEVEGKVRPRHKLHMAVKRGDHEATKDILRASAGDVNVQDHKGRTPLHVALKKRDHAIIATLLQSGASTKVLANDGCSPFDFALRLGYEESTLSALGWPRVGSPRHATRTSPGRQARNSPTRALPTSPRSKDEVKDKHKSPLFGATIDKISDFLRRDKDKSGTLSSSNSSTALAPTPSHPPTSHPASSATPSAGPSSPTPPPVPTMERNNTGAGDVSDELGLSGENPLLGTSPVLWNPAARSPRTSVQMSTGPSEYGDAARRLERVDARLQELMRELSDLQTERAQLVKVLEKTMPRPLSHSLVSDGPALV